MKKFALLTSFLAFAFTAMAGDRLPTYNSSYYQGGKLVEKHIGSLVAVEGMINEIVKGPQGKPIFNITLTDGVKQKLWVASLVKITKDMVDVGTTVRVLGFLDETAKEPDFMKKLSKNRAYLLGFCFFDVKTERPMYLTQWMKRCIKWENGIKLEEITR
jgi:hypothetical protein